MALKLRKLKRIDNLASAVRHRLFIKKHGDWWERTTERKIENDQLPERLRNKIKPAEEVDIQDDIGELKNEV